MPDTQGPRLRCPPTIALRYDAIVGWDCEYQVPPDPTAPNDLLSYQLAWHMPPRRGAPAIEGDAIWWPSVPGHRPTLGDLVALVPLPEGKRAKVLLVAHNGLAEVAHLEAGSRPKVAAIQKCPVTFVWHRVPNADDTVQHLVDLRDTMLLAAAGAKSLAACAATNEHWRKVDLDGMVSAAGLVPPEGMRAIEAMRWLLATAPDIYEAYAMHDAWAALEYYLRFQDIAHTVYGLDRPAMTAVGMSQGAFLAALGDEKYRRWWGVEAIETPDEYGRAKVQVKPRPERVATEALARLCYKGGCNTTYYVGWTHDR